MKRAGNLYEAIAEPDNLRLAYLKARRGKQNRPEVLRFAGDLDRNLTLMRQGLLKELFPAGDYHYFTVYDPKQRRICAPAFFERVLHHAIINICEPVFERRFIFDTYACRKGKGSYRAVLRAQYYAKRHPFYLKMDIRKFFDSISHEVLKRLLFRQFKDRRLLRLFNHIIDSYESAPGCGVPIGNLTSQYFANRYLDELDHMVKEVLTVGPYIRYMDDFVLMGDTKSCLKDWRRCIETYLHDELKLTPKEATQLNRVAFGMPFLGFRIYPDRMRLTPRSKRRFRQNVKACEKRFHAGFWTEEELARHVTPMMAFVMQADTNGFRKAVFSGQGVHSQARTE